MAGFKQTVLDLEPEWFLTFDGDAVSPDTKSFVNTQHIIDETGHTEGIMHDEDPYYKGYLAGQTSLVEAEINHQASIRFGANMRNALAIANGTSLAPCSYIELKTANKDKFDKDEFTLILLMKKDANPYPDWTWTVRPNASPKVAFLQETFFRLGNLLEFRSEFREYSGNKYIIDAFFNEDGTPVKSWTNGGYDLTSVPWNFGVKETEQSMASFVVIRYKNARFQLMVDGETVMDDSIVTTKYDSATHTVPQMIHRIKAGKLFDELTFFLGGRPTEEVRATSPKHQIICKSVFDQVALFSRYVSDEDLVKLFRRVWFRENMYKVSNPNLLIPFNDKSEDVTNQFALSYSINEGRYDTTFFTDLPTNLIYRLDGQYIGEYGIRFKKGGMLLPYRAGSSRSFISFVDFNSSFTLEFSIKGQTAKRCAVFQAQEISVQEELSVFANSYDGQYRQGWVEVRYLHGQTQAFNFDLLDDRWHKVAIRKNGNKVDIWLDADRVMSNKDMRFTGNLPPVTCNLLNSHDPDTDADAAVSQFVYYTKALNDFIMDAHTNYDFFYMVQGQIVQGGNPYRAKVRIYSHTTGRLLNEVWSDATTGNYKAYLGTNEWVDIMVLDSVNNSVQLRAVGPINPDTINDTQINP